MRLLILALMIACSQGLSTVAFAQGTWFDIGSGEPATVHAPNDAASWIYYPAYCFGEYYAPGTLVYSELSKNGPEGPFAETYSAFFDDGGCGCGAIPPTIGITYRLHYDEEALSWPEEQTSLYVYYWYISGGWALDSGAVLDTDNNVLQVELYSIVPSVLKLAIGPSTPALLDQKSWGTTKALFIRERQ